MTTPDLAEARRLAAELPGPLGGTPTREAAASMLRALVAEVERLGLMSDERGANEARMMERNTELQAELERLRAQVAAWETQLTDIMPPDFKDWHENSRADWPRVTVEVIKALHESEAFWIDAAGRCAPAQQAEPVGCLPLSEAPDNKPAEQVAPRRGRGWNGPMLDSEAAPSLTTETLYLANEARSLAPVVEQFGGATAYQGAAMLRTLAEELERLRAQVAPADLRERLAEAHDASLDDDHRACRSILTECMRLIAAPAQQAEPATDKQSLTVGERARALVEHLWKTDLKGIRFHLVADLKAALDAKPAAQAEPVDEPIRPIDECYGDCPRDQVTCPNPCSFEGRYQPKPAAQGLGEYSKRVILDAIRSAYDLGYNDARNARTVPGDSAPGYTGRQVETDHGGALIATLERLAAQAPAAEPLTDERIADLAEDWATDLIPDMHTLVRAIERAHGIGKQRGKCGDGSICIDECRSDEPCRRG